MNLRALRRRRPRKEKEKEEKAASSPRQRRLGVAGDPSSSSSSSGDRLLMAVCSGDADDIRKTLDGEPEAGRRRCCVTPEILSCACATGNALSVAILVERCADAAAAVNWVDGRGEAPIHSAVRGGSTEVIRALMDAQADVNAQTKYERRTPLHLATAARNLHVLQFLLGCCGAADVNRADIYGSTPLHVASEVGFSNGTAALLRSSADPDLFDRGGWTPLHLAAANGHASIVEQLVGGGGGGGGAGACSVDRQNQFGRTALHWACSGGHAAVVRLLLRHGASVEVGDRHGKRAADHAATDEIRRMVDAGAEAVRFSVLSHLDSGAMHYSAVGAQLRRSETTKKKEEEKEEEESLLKRPLRFSRHWRETGRPSSDPDNWSSSSSLDGAPMGVWSSDWNRRTTRGARSLPLRTSDEWTSTEEDPDDCSGERRDAAQVNAFRGESAIGRTKQAVPMDWRLGHRPPHSLRRPSTAEASGEAHPVRLRRPAMEEEEEEEEDSPASEQMRTSGGSLETILEHENNSTSKRTEVISERSSETKSSSADIEFSEKPTEIISPLLEDSGFGDDGSEERRLIDGPIGPTPGAEDEDAEQLSRNVKSALDRMSFASESETTLDDFVQRIRNSSNAYIDSFSSSLKHLVQNLAHIDD